jgi:hypothetical protein
MTRESLFTLFCLSHMMAKWLEYTTPYALLPFHIRSKILFPYQKIISSDVFVSLTTWQEVLC